MICHIVSAGDFAPEFFHPEAGDLVLACDAGLSHLETLGFSPDLTVGDFDSYGAVRPSGQNVVLPREKDDTDTMLCIKYAIAHSADEILIAGGIGGRLDHTIANVQSLKYALDNGVSAILRDAENEAFLISESCSIDRKDEYYFSLFAYGEKVKGLTLKGTKYELDNGELTPSFPLGVSNEITADKAVIRFESGTLLAIFSKKTL